MAVLATVTPGGDYLVKAMGRGGTVRGLGVRSTHTAHEIARLHHTLPTAAAAITRLVTAGLLMGGTLKGREQVSLRIEGDGPLGPMMVIADARGNVRATLHNPFIDLPSREGGRFDLGTAIGPGKLIVTKSLGLREPYHSVVPLVNSEIATDVAHYFLASEQKPTAMGLGEQVNAEEGVRAAGGFLIQAFPGAEDAELARIEDAIGQLPPLSQLFGEGARPEHILARVIPDLIELVRYPVQRFCGCSREKLERTLIALGADEVDRFRTADEAVEMRCHFCNTNYVFTRDDLARLWADAR
jgi:molecular chaperone Hsp33